ncbi:quinol monooxygenase YgiN [Xanthomonas arboricola]|uniref:putative quinol monooxygenase n=1 Tax=Xanthomonas euroxanthea TaxID=2259622 RepID=UPI00141A7CB6|nr:putative quinol monooxygenase [Xanthomonas euroxanthea]MBB3777804.1 quinol monooxygenase YgiN [Xanthomonas euroxanthea]NIK08646.1 quinol monooxygenase YgiN [Xanthomonas euroxanthea]NIK40477.1 quinol monooxygenase YgiN [Xanthomonas euroxanthea]
MTVPVVALFLAKPGCEMQLETLFRGVISATLKEEGCHAYQLNRSTSDPRRFVWTEQWESLDLLEKHLAAPHIAELFALVPPLVESSEVIPLQKLAGGRA